MLSAPLLCAPRPRPPGPAPAHTTHLFDLVSMHYHPGSFQFREAKVRGMAPGEPGHSTRAEAVELDE